MSDKLISIIIPVFNEADNLHVLHASLQKTLNTLVYNYEIIFINDGSEDKSAAILEELSFAHEEIRYLEFSRNFGKEVAMTAGLHIAKGDAAIIMDADLQHPPEIIPQFIKKWESGIEMVVGLRQSSVEKKLTKKVGAYFFYKIMGLISSTESVPYSTDFRLLDRKIIDEFNRFTERNRLTRGLLDWMGFKKDFIPFEAPRRVFGTEKYSTFKLIRLAVSSFIAHSLFPLKFSGYLGIFITGISGILATFIIIEKYVFHDPLKLNFTGTAVLALAILFLMGIVFSCLGLIALYIANIHTEVTNRPLYIVRKKKI